MLMASVFFFSFSFFSLHSSDEMQQNKTKEQEVEKRHSSVSMSSQVNEWENVLYI